VFFAVGFDVFEGVDAGGKELVLVEFAEVLKVWEETEE
jgi:hypothetical protein